MPLAPDLLRAWLDVVVVVDGQELTLGDRSPIAGECFVILARVDRSDLGARLRQARRTHRWVTVLLRGQVHEAALVEDLERHRAVKLGYKTGLPVVVRLAESGLSLCYTGR